MRQTALGRRQQTRPAGDRSRAPDLSAVWCNGMDLFLLAAGLPGDPLRRLSDGTTSRLGLRSVRSLSRRSISITAQKIVAGVDIVGEGECRHEHLGEARVAAARLGGGGGRPLVLPHGTAHLRPVPPFAAGPWGGARRG